MRYFFIIFAAGYLKKPNRIFRLFDRSTNMRKQRMQILPVRNRKGYKSRISFQVILLLSMNLL
jgi:hypothetical protein